MSSMSWNDSKSLGRAVKRACISRGECDSYTVLFGTAVMASVDAVPVEMTNVSAGGFSENLLLLEFRDGLRPARFAHGKCDFVASVQCIQHAVLHLELFGSSAGIGSDSAALRLLNGDGPTNPIDCGDRSRKRLLGQRHRTDDREHRTSQNRLCESHRDPSVF